MKTLRFWIILLLSIAMVSILGIGLTSAYFVTKNNLIDEALTVNKEYSQKMAVDTEELFENMQNGLSFISKEIPYLITNQQSVEERLERFLNSSNHFNSMSVVNKDGVVLATSPDVGITGQKLTSDGVLESLKKRAPIISAPYVAATGRLIVLVSAPLWDENNRYIGFVGGTIYLQEDNSLQEVLGTHFANNGSYLWVVDHLGTILYHPDPKRIGDVVTKNAVTKQIMKGKSGAQRVTNTLGQDFLASYTYLHSSKWGIVSQTPYEVVVGPVSTIISRMFWLAIPFLLLLVILSIFAANKITYPLRDLANYSQQLRENGMTKGPKIPDWYFEANQLNETLQAYALEQKIKLDNFEETSLTDALTGLKNRRFMNNVVLKWLEEQRPFSALMVDIDKFKLVNDTYGHNVGDEVLQYLAKLMNNTAAGDGLPIRLGGEEFIILLPDHDVKEAKVFAETLRRRVQQSISPTGKAITVSGGVGEYVKDERFEDFLHRIDTALYEAKQNGRNRVEISTQPIPTP